MLLRDVFVICLFRRNGNHDSRILRSAVAVKSLTVSVEAMQRGCNVLVDDLDCNSERFAGAHESIYHI